MRTWLVAVGVGAALAAVLTYPTIVHPGSRARIDTGDGRFSVWNVAWVAHALVDDPRHMLDANIFHPHRRTLTYSEANLVAGALAAPAYVLTRNPVAAHNVAVYIAFVLSFVAMWALVRRLTGAWATALVSATTFTFAPYVSARTAHVQLMMIFVFPVAFLALHRFVELPGIARGAVLGLALATAALANGYFGIYAGLAVGLGVLWFAVGQRSQRRYWLGVAAALVVAAACVAPLLQPYLSLRSEGGARRSTSVEELRSYSADARAYLTSPAWAHRWITRVVGQGREVLFPGVIVTILGAVGIGVGLSRARERRSGGSWSPGGSRRIVALYVALGGLAAWASFGPDAGLYSWLDRTLPFMSFMRAPARIGILVVFSLAVLSGFALASLPERRRAVTATGLVLLVAAEVAAAPWPLREVPAVPRAYRVLGTLPRGPVVELRFEYRSADLWGQHTRNMFWSMWHWQPMVNGYSDYIPPDFREIMTPINFFPDPASFEIMRARQVRYLLVDWTTYSEEGQAIVRARFPPYREYIRTVHEAADVSLYEIVGYPPSK